MKSSGGTESTFQVKNTLRCTSAVELTLQMDGGIIGGHPLTLMLCLALSLNLLYTMSRGEKSCIEKQPVLHI